MPSLRKVSRRAGWPLLATLLASVLLVVWQAKRRTAATTPVVPLDDWDIPQLVVCLNREGLKLRTVATRKDGVIAQTAFLTTTSKGWEDLTLLPKVQEQINRWQGTLYCERGPRGEESWADLDQHWGDCYLVVGPFLFFGDRELLGRVRTALTGRHR
jgi:hypothetical protein